MQFRGEKFLQIAVLFLVSGVCALTGRGLPCQAQSNSDTLVWSKANAKKSVPRPARARPKVKAPLPLRLELQLLKKMPDGRAETVNPLSTFFTDDQIRIWVRPNQDGYLYVFNHSETPDGRPVNQPQLIYPDSRLDSGRNFLRQGQEYNLPGSCLDGTHPDECWYTITPPVGNEVFTIVYSRELLLSLVDRQSGINQQQVLEELVQINTPFVRRTSGSSNGRNFEQLFSIFITSTNPNKRAELIERFLIKHQ
ncbi:MAG TPA: DUF4384 domain-containing protein [Acidobacteriota bacterium]|nr:DUF4384 domain-containing protein [Acidobacteriota bacterium]HNC45752.1 DUF4384 domain-containing protein [Acidobacteriota bacterium]HND18544.1 DUF4384 domain-containing protein [Acidobacteriota bacterium]HNH83018.1 DUF4384 domain-containing protein [Acidobacteriota bacterium]